MELTDQTRIYKMKLVVVHPMLQILKSKTISLSLQCQHQTQGVEIPYIQRLLTTQFLEPNRSSMTFSSTARLISKELKTKVHSSHASTIYKQMIHGLSTTSTQTTPTYQRVTFLMRFSQGSSPMLSKQRMRPS